MTRELLPLQNKTLFSKTPIFVCLAGLILLWTFIAGASLSLCLKIVSSHVEQNSAAMLSVTRMTAAYVVSHAVLWGLGIILFSLGAWSLWLRGLQRDALENELRAFTEDLEGRVHAGIEAAEKRESFLRLFTDSSDSGIFLKNYRQEYVLVNKSFSALLGLDVEEIVGRSDAQLPLSPLAARLEDKEREVMNSLMPGELGDLSFSGKEGQLFSVFIFPIEAVDARYVGGVVVDTTRRKLAEEALRKALDEAEETNRAKNDFLANISHEIRTPLNGVTGMVDLLLRSNLTKDQASMAATIKSSSDSLLGVFNDIVDFFKIENGSMKLEPSPFSLRDMIFDAVASIVPAAYKKHLEVIVHVAVRVPDHLVGDWTRLRQILLNLLNNAIKFTEHGEITIAVRVLSQDRGIARLRLSVTDTGIGIDSEKQKRIFQPFEQAEVPTVRRYGGSGLGLAISAQLAKLMGSEISLESSPGYGASFWLDMDLPFITDDTQPRYVGTVQALNGISALVVDDNPTNLHIFKEQLQTWGVIPTTCESVGEALRLLRLSVNKGLPFDVVLTDLQMPDMNGLGLLHAMREDPELKNIPGILLSSGEGGALSGEEQLFSFNLEKPARPEALLRALAAALGIWEKFDMNSLQVKVFSHGKNVYATSLNILLVEDMEVNQVVGESMLSELGHKVTVAANGQEALDLLKVNPYDVIFMDIQMPIMDGLQATKLIKQDPSLQHLPVVAMTAYALKGDKEKYLSQDMDAYIAKPMAINELVSVLNEIMVKFKLGLPLEAEEITLPDDIAMETGTVTLSPKGFSEKNGPVISSSSGESLISVAPAAPVAADAAQAGAPLKGNVPPSDISIRSVSVSKDVEDKVNESKEEGLAVGVAGEAPLKITETMLDQEAMNKVFAGHAKLIVQSMKLYLRDAPGLLEQISKAVDADDNPALTMSAHTLKGITRYYTTGPGNTLCLDLEMVGRENKLPVEKTAALEKVTSLRGYLAKLEEEMEAYLAANS